MKLSFCLNEIAAIWRRLTTVAVAHVA